MAEVFVPLNRFQSVISTLTGEEDEVYVVPSGVSTIVLSAQITNRGEQTEKVNILIKSNNELAVPNFTGVNATGSFTSASALLELNKNFIITETLAYTTFQNNLLEDPLTLDLNTYRSYTDKNLSAVIYDIQNNTTLRTTKAANSYYDKNGTFGSGSTGLIPFSEYSSSLNAITYANELAKQVVKNESVTGSASITRLYQNSVTQSIDTNYTTSGSLLSGSLFLINQLYTVIEENIQNPVRVAQAPLEFIKNNEVPKQDALSPVVAGKLVLEDGYSLIVSGSNNLTVILSILESANE
jgi:hypothetical protein